MPICDIIEREVKSRSWMSDAWGDARPWELRAILSQRISKPRALRNGWYTRCTTERMATRMATLLYSDGFFNDANDGDEKKTQPLPIHAPACRPNAGGSMTPDVEQRREQVTLPETQAVSLPATLDQSNVAIGPPAPRAPSISDAGSPLSALVLGMVLASSVWVGLAIIVLGLAYPMSFFAHAALVTLGTWIAAAGITFAFASRPQPPSLPIQRLT